MYILDCVEGLDVGITALGGPAGVDVGIGGLAGVGVGMRGQAGEGVGFGGPCRSGSRYGRCSRCRYHSHWGALDWNDYS